MLYRMVVRIMVMVPLYAIASWISLFSVEAAFFIDAIRDVYEVTSFLTHSASSQFPDEYSLLGIRHILLLRPSTLLSRRRTLITHPPTRKTTKGTRLPCQLVQTRDGRQRSIYLSLPQTRHPP